MSNTAIDLLVKQYAEECDFSDLIGLANRLVQTMPDSQARCVLHLLAEEVVWLKGHIQAAADDAQFDQERTPWRDVRDWHLRALQPKEPTC